MKRIGAAIVIGAAVFTAGCGDAGHATTRHTVAGRLVRIGGPAPGSAVPLPGQVEARDASGHVYSATVGRNGRFHLALPPGTYRFTGHSPQIQDGKMLCSAPKPVHVAEASPAASVRVVCSIK